MQSFQVSIPALDLIDVSVTASRRKKAILKLLALQNSIAAPDPDSPFEVTVLNAGGKKVVFEVTPQTIVSFRCQKVG